MKQVHYTIKTPGPSSSNKQTSRGRPEAASKGKQSTKPTVAEEILSRFQAQAALDPGNGQHILRLAQSLEFSPMSLARKLLLTKYPNCNKSEITEMMRNFDLIPDPTLALNISFCVFNDNLESGISDTSRRCIGEEYEVKLKEMSRAAGLVFYDEGDLRREGYDKTPDLKMAIPFIFRGRVVNWIESKALFGDLETHKEIIKRQLQSYANRFGHGLVIYWFGYQDVVATLEGNGNEWTILDEFPKTSDLEILEIS